MPHQTAETLRAVTDWLEIAKLVPQMSEKRCAEIHAACEAGARAWELLAALVKQLDTVHADTRYKNVWFMAGAYGDMYNGPTYVEELDAARALLDAEGR